MILQVSIDIFYLNVTKLIRILIYLLDKFIKFLGATSSAPGSPSSLSSASNKLEIDSRLNLYQIKSVYARHVSTNDYYIFSPRYSNKEELTTVVKEVSYI